MSGELVEQKFCERMWGNQVRFFGKDDRSDAMLLMLFGNSWPRRLAFEWHPRYRIDRRAYLREMCIAVETALDELEEDETLARGDSFPLAMGRVPAPIPYSEDGGLPDLAVARNALGWLWVRHTRVPFWGDGTDAA